MAFACTLLMLDCGGSSKLQSIQITPASSATEGFDVIGLGETLQLVATGTYSNGGTKNLTDQAIYQISITPKSADQNESPLPSPPQGLSVGPTGLLTAEYPGVCTWINLNASSSTALSPVWVMSGSYTVTASDHGITSPPVYVAVASAVGFIDASNPTGACGPQPQSQ
jgi:hypothetical protein